MKPYPGNNIGREKHILMLSAIAPVRGQSSAGSNIVSCQVPGGGIVGPIQLEDEITTFDYCGRSALRDAFETTWRKKELATFSIRTSSGSPITSANVIATAWQQLYPALKRSPAFCSLSSTVIPINFMWLKNTKKSRIFTVHFFGNDGIQVSIAICTYR